MFLVWVLDSTFDYSWGQYFKKIFGFYKFQHGVSLMHDCKNGIFKVQKLTSFSIDGAKTVNVSQKANTNKDEFKIYIMS